MAEKSFTTEEAKKIGEQLGITWKKWGVEQFRMGMDVELEHGTVNKLTNVTNDNPILTGKIALAHLNEFADYYTRLAKLEKQADKFWKEFSLNPRKQSFLGPKKRKLFVGKKSSKRK